MDIETRGTPQREGRAGMPSAPNWAVTGLFLIAAGATLVLARSFFMPVILAFLLSLTFSPIRRVLSRRGVTPGVSAACLVIGLVVLLLVGLVTLSAPVRDYADNAPQIIGEVERKLSAFRPAVETVTEASEKVEELASGGGGEEEASNTSPPGVLPPGAAGGGDSQGPEEGEPERVVVDQPSMLSDIAMSAPYLLAQVALTLVLLFFLLASGDMFYEKIVHAVPRFSDKRRAVSIAYDIEKKISRYFLTITMINAGLGVSIGFAMFLMGMPNPALFGVVAFVLNYIPYLGAVTGVALAFMVGLVALDTAFQALLVALIYFGLTSLEGQFVTPYAVGRSLKLNPVVVFVAVAFWGWAWSVIGMVIAVPVLITLRAFSEHIPAMQNFGSFLSGRHVELEERGENGREETSSG